MSSNAKDASGNAVKKDASGNAITKDASGNAVKKDASGNAITKDASGNAIKDASGNAVKKTTTPLVENDFFTALKSLFQKSNLVLLLWFLAIYLIVYFILGLFRSNDPASTRVGTVSRTFDFIVLLMLVAVLIMTFYTKTDEEKGQLVEDTYVFITDFVDSETSILTIFIFIVVLYFAIYLVGIPMDYENKPSTVIIIESGAWIMLVLSMIFLFFKTVMHIDLKTYLDEQLNEVWYPGANEVVADEKTETPEKPKNEVFNIGNNEYTYEDAQTICSSYGARLAKYNEIEEAYNNGGEWCNYGWSEDQMILFPTQKDTWEKLQNSKNKHSCGRPGINGGFIDNPYARFGVNCYGVKPKPTKEAEAKLKEAAASPDSLIPKTEEDKILEMKIKYWKENGSKILNVNSFNNTKWSAL
jgi:hypothetical protein